MTVYVDALFTAGRVKSAASRYGKVWCHLFTDAADLTELHQVAASLGLARAWFQDHATLPHYDLTPNKRALAVRLGLVTEADETVTKQVLLAQVALRRQLLLTQSPLDHPE
jgi:hypothetical protein